jgi:hypothetical protein
MGDEIGQHTAWYYCLRHHTVEREGECKATDRLGPYPDQESAANALQSIREREERLEREDRAWAGDDELED